MTSKHEAERSEVREMQREKERERRRLRDRQRRQNMSQEQRERHLARRRRNYQLRRLRAQNVKLQGSQPAAQTSLQSSRVDDKLVNSNSSCFPQLHQFPTGSTKQDLAGTAQKPQTFPKRLRLTDVRHLARRLHSDSQHQTTKDHHTSITCVSTKRLRLVHVKRLARSLKVNLK